MRCFWCNKDFERLTDDHIVPQSLGDAGLERSILRSMPNETLKSRTGSCPQVNPRHPRAVLSHQAAAPGSSDKWPSPAPLLASEESTWRLRRISALYRRKDALSSLPRGEGCAWENPPRLVCEVPRLLRLSCCLIYFARRCILIRNSNQESSYASSLQTWKSIQRLQQIRSFGQG